MEPGNTLFSLIDRHSRLAVHGSPRQDARRVGCSVCQGVKLFALPLHLWQWMPE